MEPRVVCAKITGDNCIESEIEYEEVFLDDNEQDLEQESQAMVKIWQRENIFKSNYQDGDVKMSDLDEMMRPLYTLSGDCESSDFESLKHDMIDVHNGKVFVKIHQSDLKQGEKNRRKITRYCTVLYDCTAYHEKSEEPFDSSLISGSPYLSRLSESITQGLCRGLLEMHEGDWGKVLVHYDLAYGALGCMPKIPPKSNILYIVRVYKAWDEGELNQFLSLPNEVQDQVEREKIYEMCMKQKEAAKEFFKENQPREALVRYKAIVECLEVFFRPSSISEPTSREYKLRKSLIENQLVAYNKLGMHRSATKKGKQLLCEDAHNIKALYHVAKARLFLGDFKTSLEYVHKALQLEPKNREFANLLDQLDHYKREDASRNKNLLMTMSKGLIV